MAGKCSALILLLSAMVASAGTGSSWSLRKWQTEDGLPNDTVTSLAQTPDGYLWIATPTRLARFDGNRFETVSRDVFGSSANRRITTLLCRRDGSLWLGSDRGPLIHARAGIAACVTNDLIDDSVRSFLEDSNGAVWITYRGGTVCRFQEGKFKRFGVEDGLPNAPVCSLDADERGTLWFAKNGECGTFQDGRFLTLFSLPSQPVVRLARSRDGGMWLCSGTTLFKSSGRGQPETIGRFLPATARTDPTVLFEDRDGGVWIGTSDQGLFHFDGRRFEDVPTSHRGILNFLEDREGNFWVGTDGGGLDQIRPRAIVLESTASGLPYDSVRSLCEDAAGNWWAAMQNGLLVCRSDGVWTTISTNANWPGGPASCVTADPAGGVWIGTRDAAIYHWRDGQFRIYSRTEGLASRTFHSLLVARDGDLWVGATRADTLQRLHNGRFEHFKLPDNTSYVRTLAQDAAGQIWAGTVKGGLLRINPGETNPVTQIIVTGSIRSLAASGDNLWIGCAGEGLKRFKDGRLLTLTTRNGLADDYISEIIPDGNGWLWFGSDHGIFKAREQELNAALDDTNKPVQSIRYGRTEGLSGLQASHDDSPNAWRTHDGKLLMAMNSALAVVDPGRVHDNVAPPPVLIDRVLVDDAAAASYGGVLPVAAEADLQWPGTALNLPPGGHRVEVNFTALSFTAPENVVFQYRFAGFDDHWLEPAENQRMAVYPRLAAGQYQFQVRAKNGDGAWSRPSAPLVISIAPFFWQTWWFRGSLLILFTAVLIAVVRYVSFQRLRAKLQTLEQQAALNRERSRIARDIHDDLGASVTRATWLINRLRQPGAENADASLGQLSSTLRQVNASLDEIVWAANPRNDSFPYLVDFISEYAAEFLQGAGIKCRVDSPAALPKETLTPEQRHNLFLSVKEALNNIVRHARAAEVWLRFRISGDAAEVAVEDNGRGLGPAPDHPGADGLHNMRQRMSAIGGECRIENIPAGGTRIVFIFPVRRAA